jgi:surfactin synthase thioesterase subunit
MSVERFTTSLRNGITMEQLAKQVAEMALRLATVPADSLRHNEPALAAIEQLALQILSEVAAARVTKARPIGETTGCWRVAVPMPRQ